MNISIEPPAYKPPLNNFSFFANKTI